MNYNWDWGILFREPFLDWIVNGFIWTLLTSFAAWLIAISVGSVIGVMRTTPVRSLRMIGTCYVGLFRNIPLLVQMFLWYFVFPEVLPENAGMWVKRELPLPSFSTAVLCLGLYHGARVAEQIRAGIEAVGPGQFNAGLALGMTYPKIYKFVILPVAYRITIPPLTSDFLGVVKNSSLAMTIGVLELTSQTRQIEEYTFQGFEAFTAATVLYVLTTISVLSLMNFVEERTRVPGVSALGVK